MLAAPQLNTPDGADPRLSYTDHALLILWGEFARQIGLLDGLMGVPLAQKTVAHAPQTKLVQLLVTILAGCAHVQEMALGPNPLVKDRAVAAAWGQPAWADPSGVSRTCQAADTQTVAGALAVLQQVSQPFIDREVLLAVRQQGRLVYDADLTGREVSPTSKDYPGAAYGWMSDHVGLGYQAAVASLSSPTYGRILLWGHCHPGDTVAVSCLQELVGAAEDTTGVRPRRRPDLVAARLQALGEVITEQRDQLRRAEVRVEETTTALAVAAAERARRTRLVEGLIAQRPAGSGDRPERPYGQVAQARAGAAVLVRRCERRQQEVARAEGALTQQRHALSELETTQTTLTTHHARLVAENATNHAPIPAVFRVDAGFASGPNLAWLIELGYDVATKAHHAQVTAGLLATKPPEAPWERVGKNAELWVQTGVRLSNCPYPFDAAVERFQTGDTVRYSTLLHYGADGIAADAVGWFQGYNRRQTIEAGIKENKGVFQMRHLKLRSPAGLAMAEAFARFAANMVRWAAGWLTRTDEPLPPLFAITDRPVNVKQLVRTAANTSAWVSHQSTRGVVVTFTDRSPFAGVELAIGCSSGFQLPLPLLKSIQFSAPETISPMVAHKLR